jgi:hypothetical protein
LPFLAYAASFIGAVFYDPFDKVEVITAGLKDESFANQLCCNDLLFVIGLFAFIEDELTGFFGLIELFLNGFCVFWFVLLLFTISCQVCIDTDENIFCEVQIFINLSWIVEDL